MKSRLHLPLLIVCFALMAACGGKVIPTRDGTLPTWMGTLEDLRRYPQDLTVYAKAAGEDKVLVSAAEQANQTARFMRLTFGPWEMVKTSTRKRDVTVLFNKARGYKDGYTRWTQAEWDSMSSNAALGSFPSRSQAAIAVRNTNLRELPTNEPRFSEPTPDAKANPFDYFQYSLLPVGTPVLIAHTSRDGRWHYVECAIAGGWVADQDLAPVSAEFKHMYRNSTFAAFIRDKVNLATPMGSVVANIGTILPMRSNFGYGAATAGAGQTIELMTPVRGMDGMAELAPVTLSSADAVAWPMRMTPGNVAKIGNVMMGQPYGWGGMFGDRDCSALTRELLATFGIWLPRNSVSQARTGSIIMIEGMPTEAKEDQIMRNGVPFLSLVGMRGHIMLYVGKYNGRPAIFHNVWGVRTVEDNDTDRRFVIGRAVVTSITPGAELKNLYRTTTFADRLRTLSTPADTLQ
ncbi:MAG: peptidase P60 [Deltaproteobacteria bacterium]|nr:peptidase P60 [Deltaproteobacteria bacterium]